MFEIISYFFKYQHLKLDKLFCRRTCSTWCCKFEFMEQERIHRNSISKKKWVKHQKVSKVDIWKVAGARLFQSCSTKIFFYYDVNLCIGLLWKELPILTISLRWKGRFKKIKSFFKRRLYRTWSIVGVQATLC